MDDSAYKLFALLKEITSCCQDREMLQARSFGLTPAESRCLIALKLNGIKTTAELAEKMLVAKSRVTRILDGLVEKGYVTRREGEIDRRVCMVVLTPEGEKLTERFYASVIKVHREVVKTLPREYRDEMLKLLETLHTAMQSAKDRLAVEEGVQV